MTKLKAVLLVLLLALLGAACGNDDDDNGAGGPDATAPNQRVGDTAEQGRNLKLVAAGKLTVCTDVPYAPFEYEEGGKVVGIDADLMRAVGGRLGLTAEFRDTDFSGIFAAMEAGQCDVIASSVSITEERKKTLDFSEGYYDIVQSLLVRKADESKYTDLPTLRGRTVGVQSSTTGADHAKSQAGANGYSVKEFEGADDLFAALKSGQIDAIVQDFPVNAYNAKVSGETVVTKKFEAQKEQYGVVMKKGRDDLKKAVNDALARIRADDTYNSILRTYLGRQ
jgi:polar amino acid transport system substrate-binding protein